jgi:hypothetical protein
MVVCLFVAKLLWIWREPTRSSCVRRCKVKVVVQRGGGKGNLWEKRREEYLTKAKEAEAAKTTHSDLRESWLKMAASYRELAHRPDG